MGNWHTVLQCVDCVPEFQIKLAKDLAAAEEVFEPKKWSLGSDFTTGTEPRLSIWMEACNAETFCNWPDHISAPFYFPGCHTGSMQYS